MNTIILASTSPRRRELLAATGLTFNVMASDYEEDMTLAKKPKDLAKYLSRGKAQAVATKHPDAIVIAADTFVVYKERVLGKPKSKVEAKRMLQLLSGKAHSIVTGFTVMHAAKKRSISKAIETKVYLKKLTSKEIDNYIASGEPMDKAGAYAIQGLGGALVKRVDGDYLGAVGLPLYSLAKELKKFGVTVL